jgi:hypothetical protein
MYTGMCVDVHVTGLLELYILNENGNDLIDFQCYLASASFHRNLLRDSCVSCIGLERVILIGAS